MLVRTTLIVTMLVLMPVLVIALVMSTPSESTPSKRRSSPAATTTHAPQGFMQQALAKKPPAVKIPSGVKIPPTVKIRTIRERRPEPLYPPQIDMPRPWSGFDGLTKQSRLGGTPRSGSGLSKAGLCRVGENGSMFREWMCESYHGYPVCSELGHGYTPCKESGYGCTPSLGVPHPFQSLEVNPLVMSVVCSGSMSKGSSPVPEPSSTRKEPFSSRRMELFWSRRSPTATPAFVVMSVVCSGSMSNGLTLPLVMSSAVRALQKPDLRCKISVTTNI